MEIERVLRTFSFFKLYVMRTLKDNTVSHSKNRLKKNRAKQLIGIVLVMIALTSITVATVCTIVLEQLQNGTGIALMATLVLMACVILYQGMVELEGA
jgi:Mg2+/Co2+ transporter CorB